MSLKKISKLAEITNTPRKKQCSVNEEIDNNYQCTEDEDLEVLNLETNIGINYVYTSKKAENFDFDSSENSNFDSSKNSNFDSSKNFNFDSSENSSENFFENYSRNVFIKKKELDRKASKFNNLENYNGEELENDNSDIFEEYELINKL